MSTGEGADPWGRAAGLALLVGLAAWLAAGAWPPSRTRDEYLALLVAAEAAGRTPRDQAAASGWGDRELGRAAAAYGDQATQDALAARLAAAGLVPPRPPP